MEFSALMKSLADNIGLDTLEPDENGECQLLCEETAITIQDCPSIRTLFLTAPVAQLSVDEDAIVLRKLLEANFAFAQTRGATLSISPDTSVVYLSRYENYENLSREQFLQDFTAFVTVFYNWQKRIEEFHNGDVSSISDQDSYADTSQPNDMQDAKKEKSLDKVDFFA